MRKIQRSKQPSVAAFLESFMQREVRKVESTLEEILPDPRKRPTSVHRAMRYAVLGGGKRIRPLLAVLAFRACGGTGGAIYRAGAALELIHNFTLIHDDLPCMDDDRLRRGEPTVHVAFGEAIALLAGDALLSLAFEVLASLGTRKPSSGLRTSRMIHEIAHVAGTMGIVGGQVLDMESEGRRVPLSTVTYIHTHKTGALIACSVRVGALLAGASRAQLEALSVYGKRLGFAFQIVDDIRDLNASSRELGKARARDKERHKATFPLVMGLEKSLEKAHSLVEEAKEQVRGSGRYERYFCALADYVVHRAT